MPMVRRTASGVMTEPDSCRVSNSRMTRSAKATSLSRPAERDPVAADVDVGGQMFFQQPQQQVA